ncbi:MAG TPA: hypothetical protein VJ343_02140 [archaeon]|nr:hypothetical protein [archaeon]
MSIAEIIAKSLGVALDTRKFLPFFFLYLLFFISSLIFTNSMFQVMPPIILGTSTGTEISILIIDMVALFVLVILLFGANIWFSGALVFELHKGKGFRAGLKYSRKLYWKFALLAVIVLILFMVASFFGNLGFIVDFLIGWVLMFSFVSIAINGDDVQKAMTRSYDIIRKNIFKTIVFFAAALFVTFIILLIGTILVGISLYPLFFSLSEIAPPSLDPQTLTAGEVNRMFSMLLQNHPLFVMASVMASFFLSLANVFILASKTYYFLSFKKK